MTEREPYLALRDFQVWFSKRRGFVAALRRSEPGFVRAVDGIDLTIGKGEIYCLVGESGCGKTTTGKGILQLVEPTGGDVFLSPTAEEISRFDAAKSGDDAGFREDLRKRKSLTYQAKTQRSARDWIANLLFGLAGVVLAILAGTGMLLGLHAIHQDSLDLLGYVAAGVVLGLVGTLPWTKMSRHLPHALSLASIPATVIIQIALTAAALAAAGRPADLGAALSTSPGGYLNYLDENTLFVALLEILLAALATWVATGLFAGYWDRRRGVEADWLRKLRTRLQIVFQDPYESLNPRHTVYDIVSEPLLVNRVTRGRAETAARVERAVSEAGLRPPRDYLLRYPHELSGGQRQRVGIAGALVLEPEFVVADEPVSMLDVSIRTEIVELLLQLREKRGLTYLFITHDLSLAYVLADRVGVMYLGKIVEEGPTEELIANPRHPYTKALISVVPIPDPDIRHERMILKGERPDPSNIPPGCRFHPRCPAAFEKCGWTSEELLDTLRELAVGDDARFLLGAAPHGPGALAWRPAPDGLEAWLRGLVTEKAESHRALKAVQSIQPEGGGLMVVLHPFEEPTLKTVAPGVIVSCHLY